jgi:hypothetical protein
MSQENVEQLRRGIDDFNRRDLDAYLARMDDEVEYVPRVGSMEGSYHGRDGIRRFWENLLGVWPDLSVQIRQVRDFGDVTLATLDSRGQGAGSEVPWDWTVYQIVRWRQQKAVWLGHFGTREEALEAVGLSEQDAHADS